MSGRAGIMAAALTAAFAAALAALAFAGWDPDDRSGARPRLELGSKRLYLAQSAANQALIRVPNAKPGQRALGATTVTVTGAKAAVSVRVVNPRDVAGPNGRRLIASRMLWIDVRCARPPCGIPPYRGPVRDMGMHSLGTWRAGTSRTYRLRVWLKRGGKPPSNRAGDNGFQGSQAKFGLIWTATVP